MLIKSVKKVGNSLGIIIPKNVLDLTSSDENTVFQIIVKDQEIVLKKVSPEELLEYAAKRATEINKVHAKTFKKLAE